MKKIIIGIDVSKEKCDATAISVEKGIPEVSKLDYICIENRPCGFRKLLSWSRKLVKDTADEEILFICETTGAYDHSMCDYLYAKGMDIWREAALKTMWCGDLDCELQMKEKAGVSSRCMPLEQDKVSRLVRVRELEATAGKSKTNTSILRDVKKHIRNIEKSIRECEEMIRSLIGEDEALSRSYSHLDSVKGLGIVNITALIVYTNNFRSFRTSRQLASYWGVAAFRCKSGTSMDKRSNVGYLSNPMLKAYLTQAALHTIAVNGIFHEYYQRLIDAGKPRPVAFNNVKNKLLHLAMSLIRNDMDYEENHTHKWTRRDTLQPRLIH